jgi:hypothetical protein
MELTAEGRTPSLPDARPRSDRFRCGGRESEFLAVGRSLYARLPLVRRQCFSRILPTTVLSADPVDSYQLKLKTG